MNDAVHLNLDDAWDAASMPIHTVDLREWGPRLRYHAKPRELDQFLREIQPRLRPFVVYGSGDFHHLAAVLVRRFTTPLTVVSFDNHPDWDIRPPRWACGGWVNRALELPNVRSASVWGCGNFELQWPSRLFANRRDLRSGRLEIHAWAERQPESVQKRFACMTRENWRDQFNTFSRELHDSKVYVTVDLDCLRHEEAVTNWENGLFAADDIVWALGQLRESSGIVGGDICGAYSTPTYARGFQRFAGNWDHPKLPPVGVEEARRINHATLEKIVPALTGSALSSSKPAQSPR
jgi:arginase family enzyme